jgi:hypothetical protein
MAKLIRVLLLIGIPCVLIRDAETGELTIVGSTACVLAWACLVLESLIRLSRSVKRDSTPEPPLPQIQPPFQFGLRSIFYLTFIVAYWCMVSRWIEGVEDSGGGVAFLAAWGLFVIIVALSRWI